jgi:hypothetical protein
LTKIANESLDHLKYGYNLLVLDSFKQQLNSNSNNSQDPGKGVVIDVTEE